MKEMVGGCCVCSDDRGWAENPLVYCDGAGCTVAVHQACYGIVTVPVGNWYCRKCEVEDLKSTKVRCELCPNKEGALKPTDNKAWAHVVCALYIPEVRFGNVTTMEPIILTHIPQERFHKTCYICEERNRSRANVGACMQCNKAGCRQQFHVTCAQGLGLLCEEASNYMENVKYCGYCHHHYTKIKKGGNVKVIPPYRPVGANDSPEESPSKETESTRTSSKRKLRGSRTPPGGGVSPESSSASRPSSPGSSRAPLPPPPPTPPTPASHPPSKEPPPTTSTSSTPTSRPNSIVVTVPLEVLPASVPTLAAQPHPSPPPLAQNQPPSDQTHLPPAKRQRSQSSDKSEKGRRWMKRSSSGKPLSPPPQSVLQQSSGSKTASSPGESSSSQGACEVRPRRAGSAAPPPLPSSSSAGITIKEEKDVKVFQNGLHAPHMLGNQLNPSSTMAQKMCDTLSQEMVAHSVFTQQDSSQSSSLVGPQLHRQNRVGPFFGSGSSSNNNSSSSTTNHVPSSLEHLLERQWEQGSQFLMEQAQHFDIASLLSCLHQLRAENAQLEEHVTSLVQRRDHLLAVNARLAIPLVSNQHQQQQQVNNVVPNPPAPVVNPAPAVVENGMATPAEQLPYQRNTPQPLPRSGSAGFSTGNSQQHQQQNSVVVRASSGDRRSSSGGSSYSSHSNPHNTSHHGNPHSNPHGNPHGNSSIFSTGQPQPLPVSQQSQVVMRREVIGELHHPLSGTTAPGTTPAPAPNNPAPKPAPP